MKEIEKLIDNWEIKTKEKKWDLCKNGGDKK